MTIITAVSLLSHLTLSSRVVCVCCILCLIVYVCLYACTLTSALRQKRMTDVTLCYNTVAIILTEYFLFSVLTKIIFCDHKLIIAARLRAEEVQHPQVSIWSVKLCMSHDWHNTDLYSHVTIDTWMSDLLVSTMSTGTHGPYYAVTRCIIFSIILQIDTSDLRARVIYTHAARYYILPASTHEHTHHMLPVCILMVVFMIQHTQCSFLATNSDRDAVCMHAGWH